jgi:hypothetical protein
MDRFDIEFLGESRNSWRARRVARLFGVSALDTLLSWAKGVSSGSLVGHALNECN